MPYTPPAMSEAMPIPEGVGAETIEAEIAFHKGNERPPLFVKPMKASEACKQITDFTKTWPEPFAPSYAYANPWATKKDNKGKKDRPAGPMKPGFAKNGEVTL